jgi:hypothetical protein
VTRQPRRDVFRTTAGFRWVIVGVTMLFVAMLGIAFVTGPPTLFYGFVALTVFGVLGIAETMVTRIELHDDRIVAVAFFVRRTYQRAQITSVTWTKGSPVSVQLNGTEWAHLPNTGHSSQKIVGAIRAWLNEGGARHGA